MRDLNKILIAIDNSKISDEVLRRGFLLAKGCNSRVVVLHIIESPLFDKPDYFGKSGKSVDLNQIKRDIDDRIQKIDNGSDVDYSIFVIQGDIADEIIYESKHQNAQMIVLGAHSKDDLSIKEFGTTALWVTQESHLPVLVVKNRVEGEYRNILAPTDLSEFSEKSILFSKNIFNKEYINTVYLYERTENLNIDFSNFAPEGESLIVDFYNISVEDEELINLKIRAYARRNLEVFEERINISKGEIIESKTDINNDINTLLKENKNDLVIVGSHGTKNIKSFLFGSTASYLMKESRSDILVYVPK
ncbi:MAG: universal stress protein [Campylobacterota bacterium]|nr:universal stress protein [Campylobacterota bacterium]